MAYDEDTPFDILAMIEAQLGADAAYRFACYYGGRTLKVPVHVLHAKGCPTPSQEALIIKGLLGEAGAIWLCGELGGCRMYVRMIYARHAEVIRLSKENLSVPQIASRTRFSERHVYNILAVRRRRLAAAREAAKSGSTRNADGGAE